jgi:hypothetical protein
MVAEQIATLEAKNEVLSQCFDRHEAPTVEASGVDRSASLGVRCLDLYMLADEHLEAPRGPVNRVAFGHQCP